MIKFNLNKKKYSIKNIKETIKLNQILYKKIEKHAKSSTGYDTHEYLLIKSIPKILENDNITVIKELKKNNKPLEKYLFYTLYSEFMLDNKNVDYFTLIQNAHKYLREFFEEQKMFLDKEIEEEKDFEKRRTLLDVKYVVEDKMYNMYKSIERCFYI
jgi:hypothetical protein